MKTNLTLAILFLAHVTCLSQISTDSLKGHYDFNGNLNDQSIYGNHITAYSGQFGGLLLLPMDKNRGLNDLTFDKKLLIYFGENLLAKSMNSDCYQNNPQFKRFFEAENLKFKAYTSFDKKAWLERQELYEELAKKIWYITHLDEQLN